MAKIGTKAKPAVVRVKTEERAREIVTLCDEHGWQVVLGIEPDKPENVEDIKWLLKKSQKNRTATIRPGLIKVSPNDYCPCGSGLKYKKCCVGK